MQSPWKKILRSNFTHWEKLADFLILNHEQRSVIDKKAHFPLNLPLRLAEKIEKKTLEDPILKQFLPTIEEKTKTLGFAEDPVNDRAFRCEPKLLQKYHGRALLICTSACAMHCRFCFRQNFDYETEDKLFENELSLILRDPSICEVILSGGDPLSLSNSTLNRILNELSNIPHVTRIRFHTRFPIGIPERIDPQFLEILSSIRPQVWFVIHANHPKEFDKEIFAHLKSIQKLGIPVLNQAVLLRGINDDEITLKSLFELLVDHGISPYYLHQLDRVQGAAHFEVAEERGRELIAAVSKQLSGYAIPRYVKDSGEPHKTLLT